MRPRTMRRGKVYHDRALDLTQLWEQLGFDPPGAILTIPPRVGLAAPSSDQEPETEASKPRPEPAKRKIL